MPLLSSVIVQHGINNNTGNGSGQGTVSVILGSPTTPGNAIVIIVSSDSPAFPGGWDPSFGSISDDKSGGSNSYIKAVGVSNSTANAIEIHYCLNTGTAQTFTAVSFGNNHVKICVLEITTVSAAGNTSGNTDGGGSNTVISGDVTITGDSIVIFGVSANASGSGHTEGSGFTPIDNINNTNPLFVDAGIFSSTTSPGCTLSGSPEWACVSMAFTLNSFNVALNSSWSFGF